MSIAAFSGGADHTIVGFLLGDTGVPQKAFIDKEGNYACCTLPLLFRRGLVQETRC